MIMHLDLLVYEVMGFLQALLEFFLHLQNLQHFTLATLQGHVDLAHFSHGHTTDQ